MAKAEREALQFRPPAAGNAAAGTVNKPVSFMLTGTSTAAIATGSATAGDGCFVTISLSVAAHIRFGLSTITAADPAQGDMLLLPGTYSFWCSESEDTHFRAIRQSIDGIGTSFRSSD